METIAVVLNDAGHARRTLAPLLAPGATPTRWLLLAQPPRLGRRIARWSTPASRARWADDWCAQLRHTLQPLLAAAPAGATFDWLPATTPLAGLAQQLRLKHGAGVRLLDARLPRVGVAPVPLLAGQPGAGRRLAAPVAVTSALSVVLALVD